VVANIPHHLHPDPALHLLDRHVVLHGMRVERVLHRAVCIRRIPAQACCAVLPLARIAAYREQREG